MYIVSACLTGKNCKYDGKNNECAWVRDFIKNRNCALVCPEEGLLPTPRPPAEIKDGRAFDKTGKDITDTLKEGAAKAWEEASAAADKYGEEIEGAILKANSPSCGRGSIYDGAFTGTLVGGDGFFAGLLAEKGIKVTTEKEVLE